MRVVQEADPPGTAPNFNRGHCHVHVKRDVQQNKHKVFNGDSDAQKDTANKVTAKIEMIKDHSITVQLATEGKKLMLKELRADGEHSAASYLESTHFNHRWTLAEMNDGSFLPPGAAAGGVPCQSNAIERSNLEQKTRREFKRSAIVDFVTQAMDDLERKSMDDLSLGQGMPKGYVTAQKVDKTVWTKKFFSLVLSELKNPISLDKLMWRWSSYKPGTIVMCSRRMRQEILDDPEYAAVYTRLTSDAQRLKSFKSALFDDTVIKEGGRTTGRADSYLKQFQALIKKPAETIQSQDFSLTELIDWEKSFHLLQPITNDSYVKALLVRLGNEKMPLAQSKINLLFKQGDKEPSLHFYMCSCGRYRHYAWCLHVMLKGISDGLFAAPFCPPALDPTPIRSVRGGEEMRRVGRPANAQPGGALTTQQ